MSASQWTFVLLSAVICLSALAFSRALIFQGRKSGPNQFITKLLMPPPVKVKALQDSHSETSKVGRHPLQESHLDEIKKA